MISTTVGQLIKYKKFSDRFELTSLLPHLPECRDFRLHIILPPTDILKHLSINYSVSPITYNYHTMSISQILKVMEN